MTENSHLRVLLVEDNPGDARLISEGLREVPHARFELEFADRLASGLQRIRAGGIDAVLLDLGLPDSQGHETFRVFQTEAPHVPIIVLSGLGDEALALKTVQEGAQDYLVKGQADASLLERSIRYAVERKKAEQALWSSERKLRKSEASFRSLVLNSPYAIFRSNLQAGFLDANPALIAMLGYASESELPALDVPQEVYANPSDVHRLLKFFLTPAAFRGVEARWKRKDGKFITVSLTGLPVHDEQGALTHYEIIGEDITERKALEFQFRQSQKMESVGRLAGGVAHDFNNLLAVIIGYSELLEDRLGQDHGLHKSAREINKAAQRAASLTRQLLAFSRRQVLEPKILNLNTVVADFETMLRRVIGEEIEMTTVLAADLGNVKADKSQIEQVLMNLVVNARDAMPSRGKILLETRNAVLDGALPGDQIPISAGRYVVLTMTDTGAGMDKETQGRIFEPFFTTKEPEKGTGLGLAVVYGVVKQSGGYIEVQSELGAGTTFRIYLPRVDQAVERIVEILSQDSSRRGSETVLVVEDEASLQILIRDVLASIGYNVLTANSGPDAVAMAQKHSGSIHVLLTDVVLPGMSGCEAAERIAAAHPEVKTLFISGYSDFGVASQQALRADAFILQKPFTRRDLASKVRQVLDSRVPEKTLS